MRRIYFDTEFIENGTVIELISIGMVDDKGHELYLVSSEFDAGKGDEWVQNNVLAQIPDEYPRWPRRKIADAVHRFVNDCGAATVPEIWAYYADYDWVALCQLFGRMIDLPSSFPKYAMDLKQLVQSLGNPKLPKQASREHHALNDAKWVRDMHEFILAIRGAK